MSELGESEKWYSWSGSGARHAAASGMIDKGLQGNMVPLKVCHSPERWKEESLIH